MMLILCVIELFLNWCLQDKEVVNGGTAPRMLCLDDYFVVEAEKVVTDPETGKKVKRMVIVISLLFVNNLTVLTLSCVCVTMYCQTLSQT